MRTRTLLAIAIAASFLSACGSYKGDLSTICNAAKLSGQKEDASLADVGPWLSKNVRTRKGRSLLESLASGGSAEVALAEAKANGITPCPFLEPR